MQLFDPALQSAYEKRLQRVGEEGDQNPRSQYNWNWQWQQQDARPNGYC